MTKTIKKYLAFFCMSMLLIAGVYFTFIKRSPTIADMEIQQTTFAQIDSEDLYSEDSDESIASSEGDSEEELLVSEEIPATTRHVFFDLNNVLFEVSTKQAFAQIGAVDIAAYKFGGNKSEDLENKLFEILGYVEPATPEHTQNSADLPQQNNKPFPLIMCRWLRGEIVGQELLSKAMAFMEHPDHDKYFTSKREKRLVENILRMMVDPDTRSKLFVPMKKGIALVEQCKNFGHKVYLVANTDQQLMALMQQKHPEVFRLFDGVIVSSQIQALKPGRTFFDRIFKQYRIQEAQSFFIDGAEDTVQCVQALGVPVLHYKSDNHAIAVQTLKQLQILAPQNS